MNTKQDFYLFIEVCNWMFDYFGPDEQFGDEELRIMGQVAAQVLGLAMMFVIVFTLNAGAIACSSGCFEYSGNCACDAKPEAQAIDQSRWMSTEKPSRHPQTAYQRGEVKADMPPSLMVSDMKTDMEKTEAEFQGKVAAGLTP